MKWLKKLDCTGILQIQFGYLYLPSSIWFNLKEFKKENNCKNHDIILMYRKEILLFFIKMFPGKIIKQDEDLYFFGKNKKITIIKIYDILENIITKKEKN